MSTEHLTPSSATPIRCGSCKAEMRTPAVCDSCHTIHPVEDVNLFDLLGVPASYDIDPVELQRKYLNLARAVHPDRLRADTPEVETLSLRSIAQINRARTVLRDPVARAEYLLAMAGGQGSADDKTVPPEVLIEALELRQEIEDARAAGDNQRLAACGATIARQYEATLARVAELARALPGDEATRTTLRAQLNAISYYQKMRTDL